jgi:hypothetical protein
VSTFIPNRDLCFLQQSQEFIHNDADVVLYIRTQFNSEMPLALPYYLVDVVFNSDAAKAKAWDVIYLAQLLRQGDEDELLFSSTDCKVLHIRTRSKVLARRIYAAADDIRNQVEAPDLIFIEPVEECNHVPNPNPDIHGIFRCIACGQDLGKLS